MAETNPKTTPATSKTEEKEAPSRLQVFVNNHPRAAKVAAITGGVTAAVGMVQIARTLRANKDHLSSAVEHAGEAVSEVAASVSPSDTEA